MKNKTFTKEEMDKLLDFALRIGDVVESLKFVAKIAGNEIVFKDNPLCGLDSFLRSVSLELESASDGFYYIIEKE